MAENRPDPEVLGPGAVPDQPEAQANKRFNLKVVGGIAAVILVIGLANVRSATKQVPIANSAVMKPTSPNATQVNSFRAQQQLLLQRDAEERARKELLATQNAQLASEQAIPGPESAGAAPMTPAQRDAMYGKNNPNAPQKTSGQSQAQAEAKQRQLERERQHQQALNSDTVAIDFAKTHRPPATPTTTPGLRPLPPMGLRHSREPMSRRKRLFRCRHGPSRRASPPAVTPWASMTSTATRDGSTGCLRARCSREC